MIISLDPEGTHGGTAIAAEVAQNERTVHTKFFNGEWEQVDLALCNQCVPPPNLLQTLMSYSMMKISTECSGLTLAHLITGKYIPCSAVYQCVCTHLMSAISSIVYVLCILTAWLHNPWANCHVHT